MASTRPSSSQPISLERISEALQSTFTRKENLRKAFELVQSHSSALASFSLQWSDLESHFDSVQKTLETQFKKLATKEKQHQSLQKSKPTSTPKPSKPSDSEPVARSELKSFCLKMDGIGLRSFIMDHRKEVVTTREEVTAALLFASDPAKLVLDGLQGFFPMRSKRHRSGELGAIRRTCVLLLEGLADMAPEIKPNVKEEAKKLAVDWKGKVSTDSEDQLEALVFLQLLGSYELAEDFSVDDLLDLLVSVARRRQAVNLCKGLGFDSKVPDLIKKLSSKGKQVDAVKFAYAFDLTDKFPPVPLLKAYLEESKKVAKEVLDKGKNSRQSQNEAIARELAYVKAIINCIEEYNLESQYPRKSLEKRIEQLEKQKPPKKRPAAVAGPSPASNPLQQQSENKRPRPATSSAAEPIMSAYAPSTLNRMQHTSYMSEPLAPYLSSSTHYGLGGTNPAIAQCLGVSAGPSGAVSDHLNISTNLNPLLSHSYASESYIGSGHLYSSESHVASGLYDRPMGYGSGQSLLPIYKSFYS